MDEMTMSSDLGYNERRILDLLRSRGPMSRADLARMTALTTPSLTRLAQTLSDNQLLLELHKVRDGQRGKPAQLIKLNPDGAFAVGIAVQSEYLSACIIDFEGQPRATVTHNLAEADPDVVATLSANMLDQLLSDAGVSRKRVLGAGICMPGTAMGEYGTGLKLASKHSFPAEYSAWLPLDISKHFEQALALPCWLENSSKASALADMYFGAGQRLRNFAVIHIEYGIGGGLILERRHYRGTLGRAAEFGGLYPYDKPRPSGRDLLLFLAGRMNKPPKLIRDLTQTHLPDLLIAEWVDRVGPQLLELSRYLSVALDIEAIVFNGLLPLPVFIHIARMLREQLPRNMPPGLSVPEIIVSQHAKSGLELGAASLPLHFMTSAASHKA